MLTVDLKAPFPWFGGKSKAAPLIWGRLGDVENYIEPFFGSGAVLLNRPHHPRVETVNDIDGMVANFWRAVATDPDAVAAAADWPVNEADLHARHLWLVERLADGFGDWIAGDPDHYDAVVAGRWVWGMCAWIGSEFCSGKGPWGKGEDGRLIRRINKSSISRKLPHLHDGGRGINKPSITRGLPHLEGVLCPPERRGMTIYEWFAALQARLRNVRVCCGDWSRITGPSVTHKHLCMSRSSAVVGVVFDPPYQHSERDNVYREDHDIAHDVTAWAIKHGDNPKMCVAVCGFDGDCNDALADHGWTAAEWHKNELLTGGYGKQGDNGDQQHRERVWFSPHCLGEAKPRQVDMFAALT